MSISMSDAFSWVISVISASVQWLMSWNYKGISFGWYLLALIVMGIILDYVF